MLRLRTALLASLLPLGACKSKEPSPAVGQRGVDPLEHSPVASASERDLRPVAAASYARTLEAQLDLVPPDADAYLVVRDLRPLIAQARRVEQVMAGPLARAIPALAKLGGGSGELRLAQLGRARELLALVLAGLEGSGVELDKGLVVVQGQGDPLISFAASDLQRLGALANLAGGIDLAGRCKELGEQPGWLVCSLGSGPGGEPLASYQPAKQGAALVRRLGDRLGGVELERVNLAVSLAEADGSLDAVLRTDPGLWELSVPVPLAAGQSLLAAGSAPGLRALLPGTSFLWGRIDPKLLVGSEPAGAALKPELLTGEFWLGAIDDPDGFVAQAGITDASEAAEAIASLAALLPEEPITPEQLDGVRVEFDRASISLGGALMIPSIGLTLTGEGARGWADALGLPPRARLWAQGDYSSLAIGEVQAIPAALARLQGDGPSPAAVAGLPPTLARSLLAGEVAVVMHLVLDHWYAPPSEAELASLLVGLPPELRPDPSEITALFQALAPWSSCDLWLRAHQQQWIAELSLVPFGVATGELSKAEAEAAAKVLDAVLAGGDGQAGYRELLERYPGSPLAYAYRARIGDAPDHHAALGMVELGLVAALVIAALGDDTSE
ncbi:MAG: hypothetical protein R6X02_02665 [Enhygromyxa sp.]